MLKYYRRSKQLPMLIDARVIAAKWLQTAERPVYNDASKWYEGAVDAFENYRLTDDFKLTYLTAGAKKDLIHDIMDAWFNKQYNYNDVDIWFSRLLNAQGIITLEYTLAQNNNAFSEKDIEFAFENAFGYVGQSGTRYATIVSGLYLQDDPPALDD